MFASPRPNEITTAKRLPSLLLLLLLLFLQDTNENCEKNKKEKRRNENIVKILYAYYTRAAARLLYCFSWREQARKGQSMSMRTLLLVTVTHTHTLFAHSCSPKCHRAKHSTCAVRVCVFACVDKRMVIFVFGLLFAVIVLKIHTHSYTQA